MNIEIGNGQKFAVAMAVALALLPVFGGPALAADPTVTIAAPSKAQGDMGAALGNVIDGNDLSEIKWLQPDASGHTISYQQKNGVSGAYGGALYGETPKGKDLATAFYTDSSVSIPGDVYKYLLFRVQMAPHHAGEAGAEATNGVIIYSSVWDTYWYVALANRRTSKGYMLYNYGDWALYFFDLSQDITGPPSPNPWRWGQPGEHIEAFGLWVHENWVKSLSDPSPSGDSPDYFYIDYLYLTGNIVTLNDQYTVKWQVNDADGGTITSDLYYKESDELLLPSQSPSCNSGNIGEWHLLQDNAGSITLNSAPTAYKVYLPIIFKTPAQVIFSDGNIGPYNQQYTWTLADDNTFVPGKVYYVCVEATDPQGHKGYAVSSAPVIKTPAFTVFP